MMMMSCSENYSSEESDHQQEVEDESSGGGSKVRCYECTFCKRGFTNAQALGGHMNIHRKDRAKTKQVPPLLTPKPKPKPTTTTSSSHNEDSLLPSPFVSQISAQYQYYSILESHRNYNMHFHPSSAPNPRNPPPPTYHHHSLDVNQHQELLAPNLSLQIGQSSHVDSNQVLRRSAIHNHNDGELDLELRLGHHHHPY